MAHSNIRYMIFYQGEIRRGKKEESVKGRAVQWIFPQLAEGDLAQAICCPVQRSCFFLVAELMLGPGFLDGCLHRSCAAYNQDLVD